MKHLLINAIDIAITTHKYSLEKAELYSPESVGNCMLELKKYEDLKKYLEKLSKIDSQGLLMKGGGNWLGTVRNWIQRKAYNGETVTWGSHDYLKLKELTVSDLEQLAALIAANAIRESMEHQFSFLKN
jgi:hypothetical protein